MVCLALLLAIPSDPKNTGMFGISAVRMMAAAVLLLAVLVSAFVAANLPRDTPFWHEVCAFISGSSRWRCPGIWAVRLMLLGVLLGVLFLAAWI
jgi:hypothetical protein